MPSPPAVVGCGSCDAPPSVVSNVGSNEPTRSALPDSVLIQEDISVPLTCRGREAPPPEGGGSDAIAPTRDVAIQNVQQGPRLNRDTRRLSQDFTGAADREKKRSRSMHRWPGPYSTGRSKGRREGGELGKLRKAPYDITMREKRNRPKRDGRPQQLGSNSCCEA